MHVLIGREAGQLTKLDGRLLLLAAISAGAAVGGDAGSVLGASFLTMAVLLLLVRDSLRLTRRVERRLKNRVIGSTLACVLFFHGLVPPLGEHALTFLLLGAFVVGY